MEQWRKVWREGLAPQISRAGLNSLRLALLHDDPDLIQGATVSPPGEVFPEEQVEAACALCYCGWKGEGLGLAAEAEAFFANTCAQADEALGEPAAARHFLDWYDRSPRAEVRRMLLAEVNRLLNDGGAVLRRRAAAGIAIAPAA